MFAVNEIVVFVGYADDAYDSVQAVLDSETELQGRLDSYCRVAHVDPPVRFKFWAWRRDAENVVGGQGAAVAPALAGASAGFFVFRDRVGDVTWQELETLRDRRVPIIAVFPKGPAGDMADAEVVASWLDLLKKKKSLTADWTDPDGKAIAPVADYASDDDIRKTASERLDRILATLVAERSRPADSVVDTKQADVELTGYLEGVLSETDHFKISGIGADEGGVKTAGRYPIERLYTPLKSRGGEHLMEKGAARETEVGLVELLPRYERLLIEGQPGSGKSTFLKLVATMLARDGLETPCPDGPTWRAHYLGLDAEGAAPVPVWMRLSELVPLLEDKTSPRRDNRQWLLDYLESLCEESGYASPRDHWETLFTRGDAVILLDGFDEVASDDLRERVYKILRNVSKHWSKCNIIVTSRPVDTRSLREMGFHVASIEPFREPEIHRFLDSWVHALHDRALDESIPASAATYRDELLEAIDDPPIRLIAKNPVMLTCLSVVHWNEGRLPEGRSRVYRAVIRWLVRARSKIREHTDYNERFAWRGLAVLALHMMRGEGGKRAAVDLIGAAEAVDPVIERAFPGKVESERREIAKAWLEFECLESGVIEKLSGNRVRFWHLTFQEFLAALQLAWLGDGDDAEKDWWPIVKGRLDDPQWRETVEHLPGCLLDEGGEGRVDKLLSRVLGPLEGDPDLAATARIAGIAGRLLQPLTVYDYEPEPSVRTRYEDALKKTLEMFEQEGAARVPIQTRIEAAEALGRGGDPRIARGKASFIDVPGTGIALAKYLVTVEEYRKFVEQSSYEREELWDEDGWKLVKQERWMAPDEWETQLQTPNRPVVGVSWWEARAYCRWLSEHWSGTVRLPSNEEWEEAATSTDGDYPWGGDDPNEKLANFGKNVGAPTSVGLYPDGNGPLAHCDLAGNVWEWSDDKDVDGRPFLRGGSWRDPAELLRSASRFRLVARRRLGGDIFAIL